MSEYVFKRPDEGKVLRVKCVKVPGGYNAIYAFGEAEYDNDDLLFSPSAKTIEKCKETMEEIVKSFGYVREE